jgi:hypothetical protein
VIDRWSRNFRLRIAYPSNRTHRPHPLQTLPKRQKSPTPLTTKTHPHHTRNARRSKSALSLQYLYFPRMATDLRSCRNLRIFSAQLSAFFI